MLLAIDAGNTNIVFALFDGAALKARWRLRTVQGRTADEYQSFCLPLLQSAGLSWKDVTAVILSSVVPAENFNIHRFCEHHIGKRAISIKDKRLDLGLEVKLPVPESLGADRVANAVAAKDTYKTPCLVIDLGTGTTFEVLDESGAYVGGAIASGVHLSLEALHRVSAKLPNVEVARPDKVCATDTVSAMQSGIYYGYLSMIDGMVKRMGGESGPFKHVVATGGLAVLFAQDSETITDVDGDLTLTGLRLIYERNKPVWNETKP